MVATSHEPSLPPPPGVDPQAAAVLEAFRRTAHVNRQIFTRMIGFERNGHPGRAVMLLVLGSAGEGITQRHLADMLHLSPPAVTVMLQKLEKHGIVERWTDEEDQRLTRIRMTAKGRELAGPIAARYADYVDATLGAMSQTDRSELERLLGVFADHAEEALKKLGESPHTT